MKQLFISAIALAFIFQSCDSTSEPTVDPDDLTVVDSSSPLTGNIPTQVVFPPGGPTDNVTNRTAFDEFSWKMFIALCWPVKEGERGVPLNPNDPNTFLNMSDSTPVVWTSYKNQWDLFEQGNKRPTPWDSSSISRCSSSNSPTFQTGMSTELSESFSVPLIDQNQNYVYFELRYNKVQYNFIKDNGLYDANKLSQYQDTIKKPNGMQMPISTDAQEGAIMVKAAWKVLESSDVDSQYYVIHEKAFDPVTKNCRVMKLGLIGFHIAQKVQGFSQWIWSSFEHINNVPGPDDVAGSGKKYNLNNGLAEPDVHVNGFDIYANDTIQKTKSKRQPIQVCRINEIPTTPIGSSTVDINKKYQKLVGNMWMKNYELVITQWPTDDSFFAIDGTNQKPYPKYCGQPFPLANCVNTTMETYFQTVELAGSVTSSAPNDGNSCMGCHYGASRTDFSYSLKLRSVPRNIDWSKGDAKKEE